MYCSHVNSECYGLCILSTSFPLEIICPQDIINKCSLFMLAVLFLNEDYLHRKLYCGFLCTNECTVSYRSFQEKLERAWMCHILYTQESLHWTDEKYKCKYKPSMYWPNRAYKLYWLFHIFVIEIACVESNTSILIQLWLKYEIQVSC